MKIIKHLRRGFAKITYTILAVCQAAFFIGEFPITRPYGVVSILTSAIAFTTCILGLCAVMRRNKKYEANIASANIFAHCYGAFLLLFEIVSGMYVNKYAIPLFMMSLMPIVFLTYRKNYLIDRLKSEKAIAEIENKNKE